MNEILNINAHLKYVEFLLYHFDNSKDEITIGQLRALFHENFKHNDKLLNQNFGIYRLLPLILMKETYKNEKTPLSGDIEKIKIIRDAISHNKFEITPNGYSFKNKKSELSFSYDEFNKFLYKIENDFYKEHYQSSSNK